MYTVTFTIFVTLVVVTSSSPLSSSNFDEISSDLDKVNEIRSLLDNLLHEEKEQTAESNLQTRVNDVVKRVFFARSYEDDDDDDDDLDTRKVKEGICLPSKERFTCTNNLCDKQHTKTCNALCDAFPLGPNRERYDCRCKGGAHGLYCNVTQNGLCHTKCPNPNHCYELDVSLSGYFCYDRNWKLKNPKDVVERSISEVETIGRFAGVVEKLLKRDCANC